MVGACFQSWSTFDATKHIAQPGQGKREEPNLQFLWFAMEWSLENILTGMKVNFESSMVSRNQYLFSLFVFKYASVVIFFLILKFVIYLNK